jgi:glycine oxidase
MPVREVLVIPTEVAVVGGGVIGLSIAARLAGDGMDVTVIDEAPISGASAVAAGMLAPVTEVHYGEEDLLRLNLASKVMYPDWVTALEEETGRPTGYRRCGTVMVARDSDDNAALDDLYRFQLELGLEVRRLKGRECREIEPALAPSIRGGILVEGDHQVDPQALGSALFASCEHRGTQHVRAKVASVRMSEGRATGLVLTDDTELEARYVVIAAGAWSGMVGGVEEVLPVRPVKGQLVRLSARGPYRPMEHNVRGLDVYLVPRADGRVVIGATVEEMGFDGSVTAGAVHDLMQEAYELVPAVAELGFDGALAGFRPGTPDNAPFIGATEIEGLIAATGHYRNGILLAPVTADAIARLIGTGDPGDAGRPFSPLRVRTVREVHP